MLFVGREVEARLLDEQFNRSVPSFTILYGRRRIGKTSFVRDYCQKNKLILLEFTGLFEQPGSKQLAHFIDRLNELELGEPLPTPKSWTLAFGALNKFIDTHYPDQKVVIFLDEVPWMDSRGSELIAAIGDLWDHRIRNNPNKQLIVCGSAASYMLTKIIANKGPLHQRPTKVIEMRPFNLDITQQLIHAYGWHLQEKAICDIYIAAGGVAKYLSDLNKIGTPEQAIQDACFTRNGKLSTEYQELFYSLFKNAKTHYAIMDALAQKWSGVTRTDLTQRLNFSQPTISTALNELIGSGFIETRPEFGKTKRSERLLASDMFCYFHHKWIKPKKVKDWQVTARSQAYKSWAGFAFERICQMHTYQIKKAMGIHGIPTQTHYWQHQSHTNVNGEQPGEQQAYGAQIDMLLEHTDGSKNVAIIECKYYDGDYTITKDYYDKLIQKRAVFDQHTKHKYNIRLVLITTSGVTRNQYFNGLNLTVITLDELFSSEP